VAARPLRAHAPAVPLRHDLDDDGPVQPGLPGVLAEEAPLPSEVVLERGVLQRRAREARAGLVGLLLERPEDIAPGPWRVVQATLAPPSVHLPRSPGTLAKSMGVMQAARECFPGLSPSAALRRYREAQDLPEVRQFIADFRALEMMDVMAQRGMVREALHATIRAGADALVDPTSGLTPGGTPNEWAKVSACVTAACKVLADMDALHVTDAERAAVDAPAAPESDDASGLPDKVAAVARVAEDLRARRREPAGV